MKQTLEVGQTVWLKKRSDRYNQPDSIKQVAIETVGRKWFTVTECPRYSFSVEDGSQKQDNYMTRYTVYFSKESYDAEMKERADRAELDELFKVGIGRLPIETVRAILSILKPIS